MKESKIKKIKENDDCYFKMTTTNQEHYRQLTASAHGTEERLTDSFVRLMKGKKGVASVILSAAKMYKEELLLEELVGDIDNLDLEKLQKAMYETGKDILDSKEEPDFENFIKSIMGKMEGEQKYDFSQVKDLL